MWHNSNLIELAKFPPLPDVAPKVHASFITSRLAESRSLAICIAGGKTELHAYCNAEKVVSGRTTCGFQCKVQTGEQRKMASGSGEEYKISSIEAQL